jgi:hypothetical protein
MHASNPLDIAFVTETFPPEINGVAMTVGRLVGGLRTWPPRAHCPPAPGQGRYR